MNEDFRKYLVTEPRYELCNNVRNRQSPIMTLLSSSQLKEASHYLTAGWIYGVPEPNPCTGEHKHNHDEIIFFIGSDHHTPQVLGAEIEFYLARQRIIFNTTAAVYIPGGLTHGPLIWRDVSKPHLQVSLMVGTGSYEADDLKVETGQSEQKVRHLNADFDYEQYVVRSPIREAGAEFIKGRTSPTLTYLSGLHIPGLKYYVEFGWTFDIPVSKRASSGNQMPPMAHEQYEEIVLHIGGDPDNPEDLGADMEFHVGGQPLLFSNTSALFIPKGLVHGPIKLLQYRKPHIVMAIMLGAGSVKEGWGNSFKIS